MAKKFNVLVLMILSITAHTATSQDSSMKCSEHPPNICGPNAKCFDDESNWKFIMFGGPFCECDEKFVGKPPNCKTGCGNDYDCDPDEYCSKDSECVKGCRESGGCNFHEYCDEESRKCYTGCIRDHNCDPDEYCNTKDMKCRKVCDDHSCGKNSICAGVIHGKHCGCVEGYVPVAGKGCVNKEVAEIKEYDCTKSCGVFGKCNTYVKMCYCDAGLDMDPFDMCHKSNFASQSVLGDDHTIMLSCLVAGCD